MPQNNEIYELIIGENARFDVQDAVEWYEEQKAGLGIDFFLAFENAIEILQTTPTLYPKLFAEFRRLIIKKYPYTVYYVINESNLTIEIVAVFHTSRNIEILKKRFEIQ